jgi:hypothetical protein
MTDLEQRALLLLPRIRYAPGIWHEPRAKSLRRLWDKAPDWNLSEHDRNDLWFLVWHYRRQVDDATVVARANEAVNGQVALRF